jgi:DNA gyrase/topoisomerase IV subunit B
MIEHLKTIEQQYQVLTELEHIRKRVGMYAGSPVLEEHEEFIYSIQNNKMELQTISYIPALIKIISEGIDNVVDEHNRNPKKINELKLSIKDNEIIISDNGGIPVQIHADFGKYVPEIIFGTLRSGSNYSDDDAQSLIGTNGLGAKLISVLSEYFIVETSDGSNYFHQEYKNGMSERSEPVITKSKKHFTTLTFKPDLEYFGLESFDEHHTLKIIRRLVDVAANNPLLKVYFNDEKFNVSAFDDYISLYSESYVYDSTDDWKIGLSASSGFNQTSFVNSVETYMGGTHVNYVVNQITEKLRAYVKKKHKIDIKPSDIKSHLHVFVSCKINRPKFSSQTKENMISTITDFGSSWSCSDKFINKIITLEVVQSILDWAEAKENALKNAELRKLNKSVDKLNPARVDKFEDANEKKDRSKCTIFLTEGNSAMGAIMSARDPELHGAFALKGKPLNVTDIDAKKLMENNEFKSILTIMGLKLGEQVTPMTPLRFGKICFLTDADCITEEHYVLTESGEKLISDVNPLEDKVLTHLNQYAVVEYVNIKSTDVVIRITSGNDIVEGTPEHKHVIFRDGWDLPKKYMLKEILPTDMIIKYIDGQQINHPIDSIETIEKTITTYDLTVKGHHTFYVRHKDSENYILTHNCDGSHIIGLLINMFHSFWPELFELGYIYRFRTPLIKVNVGKDVLEFYDEKEFDEWKSKNTKKFTSKYFKGLGTSTAKDFKGYLANSDKNMVQYTIDDIKDSDSIKLAFSKNSDSADLRKQWLNIEG